MTEPEHAHEAGPPRIDRPYAKIAAIERRLDGLDERIASRQGSDASLGYDRAERAALTAALLALRYYVADGEGIDTPILALADIVDARADMTLHTTRAVEAFDRARAVLAEWRDG